MISTIFAFGLPIPATPTRTHSSALTVPLASISHTCCRLLVASIASPKTTSSCVRRHARLSVPSICPCPADAGEPHPLHLGNARLLLPLSYCVAAWAPKPWAPALRITVLDARRPSLPSARLPTGPLQPAMEEKTRRAAPPSRPIQASGSRPGISVARKGGLGGVRGKLGGEGGMGEELRDGEHTYVCVYTYPTNIWRLFLLNAYVPPPPHTNATASQCGLVTCRHHLYHQDPRPSCPCPILPLPTPPRPQPPPHSAHHPPRSSSSSHSQCSRG